VEARGAHAARLLASASPLTRELVLGTLRWQGTIDLILAPHLRTPFDSLDAEVRSVLRVGLYEAARLDTPTPVAVAEAVRVAKLVFPRAAGLVNAVLRRAAGQPWPDPSDRTISAERRLSHPAWLVSRWRDLLGEERMEAVLLADQRPAPMTLLAAASDRALLEGAGCRLVPHPCVDGVVVVEEGGEQAASVLRAGAAYAMDPTAVAVARLMPDLEGIIADLAAAPGGKSLVLASERRTATLLATDRHPGRAAMMRRTLQRGGRAPLVAVADAAHPPLRPAGCAGVLLDAPCSGTGTLRRHPEIRWRLHPSDLDGLARLQAELARGAAALLAPGGLLLYATCSLEAEENAAVVAPLGLDPVSLVGCFPPGIPTLELPSGGTAVLPSALGDGFTVHLLRRR
jgi:16S rRNA (cytosine967-C5)-methyltransferase